MSDATSLDSHTLNAMRRLIERLGSEGRTTASRDLVELASGMRSGARLTIDASVTAELGAPLLVLRLPAERGAASALDALTPREREVALLLARGMRNRDIAAELSISVSTAKDHVHSILTKTGCSSRTALTASLNRG